jgi:hypothetical protein
MAELTRKNWERGWIPSDNNVGGRKDGLLRMDNLYLDDKGIVSLVPGLRRLNDSPLNGSVHSLYSENFSQGKVRFAGLSNGDVIAADAEFNASAAIISGGNPENAAFATAYGLVFCASGEKVVRYNVLSSEKVGLETPTAPGVVNNQGPVNHTVDDWSAGTVDTGTLISTGTEIKFTSEGLLGVVSIEPGSPDTMTLSQDSKGAATDTISVPVSIADSTKLLRVRIEFQMDDENYWYVQFDQGEQGSPLNEGKDIYSVLTAKRSEFIRAGASSEFSWEKISKVRLSFVTTESVDLSVQRVTIFGGTAATLNGAYQYCVQAIAKATVDGVTNYEAKSPLGKASNVVYASNTVIDVYPPIEAPTDYFIDEWWIFRKSAEPAFDINPLEEPPKLDQWYRVKRLDFGVDKFTDDVSDQQALEEGIVGDPAITSIASIKKEFIGLTELVAGRIFYLVNGSVIPSFAENPDAYHPFQEIKLSGKASEKPLWIVVGNDLAIYVGTTADVYRISGTFVTLSDGTIDANCRNMGLGDSYKPISRSHCKSKGAIFYLSASGWIKLDGTSVDRIVGETDMLFRKKSRHDFPAVNLIPNGLALYGCAVYNDQLWTSNVMMDGTRRIFVYDFAKSYWHVRNLDPVSLYFESDGTLLGGFGGGSGNYVNELNSGDDLAGINGQDFHLLTVFDDFDLPNNRKDMFTLRVWAACDVAVSIELAVNGLTHLDLGQFSFSGGTGSEKFIEIPSKVLTLGKSWSLQIKGQDASLFKFYGITFEYDTRPPQINYLRIPPTNCGSIARKRWTSFAFVIDTLGANVLFYPIIDNVIQSPQTFNKPDKSTCIAFFTSDTVGTDMGGILKSQNEYEVFEYYSINLEETISEKLPTPTKFLLIPANDYGNPNRKRHSSYKFSINTRGGDVRFTPRIDGENKDPIDFSTSEKRTAEFYFSDDTIGVDIGGTLESLSNLEFEFYGVITPQNLEIFPPKLREFRSPETNFDLAAPKRIRTLPFKLNTRGYPVRFIPIIDGVAHPTTGVFISEQPTTLFHYFTDDVFGTDFACELRGEEWFEFYGLLTPVSVQALPVGKKFDQIGPIQFDKLGKLLAFRIHAIFNDTQVPYRIYLEESELVHEGTIATIPGRDKVYDIAQIPKTVAGTTFRFEFGPTTNAFHRYDFQVKVNESGMQTDSKWTKVR